MVALALCLLSDFGEVCLLIWTGWKRLSLLTYTVWNKIQLLKQAGWLCCKGPSFSSPSFDEWVPSELPCSPEAISQYWMIKSIYQNFRCSAIDLHLGWNGFLAGFQRRNPSVVQPSNRRQQVYPCQRDIWLCGDSERCQEMQVCSRGGDCHLAKPIGFWGDGKSSEPTHPHQQHQSLP